MWLISLVAAALVMWLIFRKREPATAKSVEQPAPATTIYSGGAPQEGRHDSLTPDQRWRVFNKESMQFVASGDWESYACVEKDKGDQLYAEGRRKRAIDIYCRVLFLQINGATDTSQMKSLGETVAPFGAHGFVTGQVYERMVECCKEATMTDDDIKARFIEAVAKTHNKAMPMDPAQAWEAIKANRAELAECDRIKREARNKARRDATALAKAKSKQA